MKLLKLPPSLLLAVSWYLVRCEAHPEHSTTTLPPPQYTNNGSQQANPTAPSFTAPTAPSFTAPTAPSFTAANGTGPAYASACASAVAAYSSAQSSWNAVHNILNTTTALLGGPSYTRVTYYENATTLCDGHPRVLYSPAVSLSEKWVTVDAPVTGTTTSTITIGRDYPVPRPTCTINPPDCDGIWADYSKSLAAAATITSAPAIPTPWCMNQTAAASYSSVQDEIRGCGVCTIYGEGVELVYFPVPTTVSRDLCAITPSASLVTYGPGAVLEAYAGKSYGAAGMSYTSNVTLPTGAPTTAVVDGHTFTYGTAYISISKVYAADRCQHTRGPVISDAILAMPSESVLSLRYSQNKYQKLWTSDAVSGYPVAYADFNKPIPWSAWNGQNICANAQDTINCGVIYENEFRPQLAIPPEITSLSPDFAGCQMWYNGLWDPPLALTKAEHAAGPTLPGGGHIPKITSPALPSPTPAVPTLQPTAIPNKLPPATHHSHGGNGHTLPNAGLPNPQASQASGTASAGGVAPPAQSYGPGEASKSTNVGSHPENTGDHDDADNNGNANNGGKGDSGSGAKTKSSYVPSAEPWTKVFTIGGSEYVVTAANKQAVIGTVTRVANGPAQTLSDGTVCSYGDAGLTCLVMTTILPDGPTTVGPLKPHGSADSSTSTDNPPENRPGDDNSADGKDSSGETQGSFGPDQLPVGDADIATVTVQKQDGGPIVLDGTITLAPGGEATTLPDGYYVSVATAGDVLIIGSVTTLDAEPATTGVDNSVSSAIRSGLGYGVDSNDTSNTDGINATSTSEARPSSTGGAATLAFEVLNSVAVVAILMVAIAI